MVRTFRAKSGAQAVVSHCLGALASATVRQAAAHVSIFCVEDDPPQLVWLGDRGEERDFARLAPLSGAIIEWLRVNLAVAAPEQRLRLVEERHRRRSSPYQVWSVELHAPGGCGPDAAHDLLAAATEALRSADARMAAQQYADAKTRYLEAKELGDKATRAGNAKRTAMTSAVEEQLDRLEKQWGGLTGRVKAASTLTKQQRRDWEADAQTVAGILGAARSAVGNDPANARQKLGALAVFVDKWEAQLSAPAASAMKAPRPGKR